MLRQLQRRLGSRIRYKIILPYMLLAALMLVLLGILAFYTIATRLQAQLDLELRDRATNTSLELETIEARILDEMKVVVGAPADPTRPLSSTADAFAARDVAQIATIARLAFDFYQPGRILAFDTSGIILVDQASALVRDRTPSLEGQDVLAANPLVQAVLTGKVDEIGDKYASLLQFGGDAPYTMFFVIAPVKQQVPGSGQDRVVGALLFAEPLDTIVQEVNQSNRATITAILNGQGQVLSSNAPNNNAELGLTPEQIALLQGRDSSLTSQLELSDQSYQVLYNPLRIRRQIDGFYAVALPRSAISQTWAESRLAVGAIALLVLCGVIFIGNSITRRITTPLSELASTALEVKSGQLERRSAIQREDEVGTLAGVLNEMTDRLLDLYRTSRQIGAELSIEGVLAQTAAAIARVLPASRVSALLHSDQEWAWYAPERREVDVALRPAALGELPVVSEAAEGDPLWQVLRQLDADAWLALPLRTQQQSIGLLLIGPRDPEASLAAVSEPLSAVASMTATALQNAMLYVTMQDEAGRKQAILQSIADGVVVFDSDGRVILSNSAATEMLATSSVLGRTLAELPLKPLQGNVELFAHNGGSVPTLYESGDRIIRLSAAPVQGLEGRQSGEVLVLHDVTAEREVDRAKTDFIATISHELRTPLTSICGYTDLLLRGLAGPLASEQTEFLTTIRQQSQSMVDVLQNVIIIASIEAGTMAPHIQPYPAAELVEQAIPAVRKAIEAKGLSLTIELGSGLPLVLADRDHFKIIMVQLLDNARRYTHTGGITVRAAREGSMTRFEVADTGQGIATQDQARLFTRFQRGGEQSGLTSKERGAGLGLAIARQLVENLGGRIWVESTVDQGSTFAFVVPNDDTQPTQPHTTGSP